MTNLNEPADGGYVAVHHFDDRFTVELFHRDARFARMLTNDPGEWVGVGGGVQVKTWQELTDLGEVAYVGEFVDRRSGVDA